jgi:adenylate cyclase
MGEVWRAHDSMTERVVALKVLPAHCAEDSVFQQRFRREAHAAARLNEPHIVPIHGYGEIDGRLYVEMRLIEGHDLKAVLNNGPLVPSRAVAIIEQVAMALDAVHQSGLVHRDVKPSNILIARYDFAYLIDFGIARATRESGLTASGEVVGTMSYIAPERIRGDRADGRADIYSLACVLAQCLTATPPFTGENVASQMMAHLTAQPPRPSQINAAVPVEFDAIVAKGMAKDPDERYQAALDLADAAREVISAVAAAREQSRPLLMGPPAQDSPDLTSTLLEDELACRSCGTEALEDARFCHSCGAPLAGEITAAEYKQVTVLFADVVHSMDIAAVAGPERLREIMAELVRRSTAVVQRYGGTVDKFTGDGIMALFGAPLALEDHAFRACLAALDIQHAATRLAAEVARDDHISLEVRVGLSSGEVIAGDIGSGLTGYTAIGEHVGIAQRMESAAPPGGVMLSESSARLVEHSVALGPTELVCITGVDEPVPARRLLSTATEREQVDRNAPTLVGRSWELNAIAEILDESIAGGGCVVKVVGPPGIGKSRLAHEAAVLAAERGTDIVVTFCESHASDIPFQVVARLLRAAMGINELDAESARIRVRALLADADAEDLLLLDDLLGIGDPGTAGPAIDPDARRRRLTALINAVTLARTTPVLFIIEDVHWIDEVSESMLADFLTVIPQSRCIVLLTYRPEYQGALARISAAQAIALRPLSGRHTSKLVTELLGSHPSVSHLTSYVSERAAGNPFFAEELVRDLAERGLIDGRQGDYVLRGDVAEVSVPATLQATIAARIDRLAPTAKRTLTAAAVIGSRFGSELLTDLGIDPALDELIAAELVDQVKFTGGREFAFRHPLVRTVAYESQLKSARAQIHRRLACIIERAKKDTAEENAALIAEHLEAAGDLRDAFGWHMRAGKWLTNRDIASARLSWEHAREIADRLPADDPNRLSMRIAPRTLLSMSVFRAGGTIEDAGFDELRELTSEAGDKVSLAMAMAGQVGALIVHARIREASRLSTEYVDLIEAIDDPMLTVALLYAAMAAKFIAGDLDESMRLAQRTIDLADNDPRKGNLIIGSPLGAAKTFKGLVRTCRGENGWADVNEGIEIARANDTTTWAILMIFKYGWMVNDVLAADDAALEETADLMAITERSGDDFSVSSAQYSRGLALVHRDGRERAEGLTLLAMARDAALQERFSMIAVEVLDIEIAREKLRDGDIDGAIDLARSTVEAEVSHGEATFLPAAVDVLVQGLLHRGADADLQEAEAAVEKLATIADMSGYRLYDLFLRRLRALLACARGDQARFREFAHSYREMAEALDIKRHIAIASEMCS